MGNVLNTLSSATKEDAKLYKRLGIHVSCEPRYEVKRLYHK